MLKIYPQKLETTAEGVLLSSEFSIADNKQTLWYLFPKEYQNDLVTERLDAFVVGLLFLALKTGNDIHVKGTLSARLHYSLNQYLIPAICSSSSEWKPLKISAEVYDEAILGTNKAAATGISCGIDSLATFYSHKDLNNTLKINFFTFFNAGSHGDMGGIKSREVFNDRLQEVTKFTNQFDIPLLYVDTNLSEILQINFQRTATLRNLSCVLHLQKKITNYYYASGAKFDIFNLSAKAMADFDILTLPAVSTESINFYPALIALTRHERTRFVANHESSYLHLDVCTNTNYEGPFKNCSACEKCMRTLLSLDLLDRAEQYKNVFDLKTYQNEKDKYIGRVLANKSSSIIYRDVYLTLKNHNFLFTYKHWFEAMVFLKKKKIKQIKNKIKTTIFNK